MKKHIIFTICLFCLITASCTQVEYVQADIKPSNSQTMTKLEAIQFLDDELRREITVIKSHLGGDLTDYFEKETIGWRFDINHKEIKFHGTGGAFNTNSSNIRKKTTDILILRYSDISDVIFIQQIIDGVNQDIYTIKCMNSMNQSAWSLDPCVGYKDLDWPYDYLGDYYAVDEENKARNNPSFLKIIKWSNADISRSVNNMGKAISFVPFQNVSKDVAQKIFMALEVLRHE